MFRIIIFRINEYIKFWSHPKSTHRTIRNTPDIFSLVNHLKRPIPSTDKSNIKQYRALLKANHQLISYTDYGSGSTSIKNGRVSISKIYKQFSISKKEGELIYKIASFFSPHCIVEFGTSLGVSTSYLAASSKIGKIYSIEGNSDSALHAQNFLNTHFPDKVKVINDKFDNALSGLTELIKPDTVVFIDGNHAKEATIKYIRFFQQLKNKPRAILISDIYWSKGMKDAWNWAINDIKNPVTIDFYSIGMIINYISVPKKHFRIGY